MKKKFDAPIYGMITSFDESAKEQEEEILEAPEHEEQGDPVRERVVYRKPEAKSRRVQMLITPTLYEELKAEAAAEGLSVNAYMNQILENREK